MKNKNIILWEGFSPIDGKPVVAILTGITSNSRNKKTGSLLQVWIMRSDIHPLDAIHEGEDESICGDCIHRGLKKDGTDRSCYVTLMALGRIFRAYHAGKYQRWEDVDKEKFRAQCLPSGGIRFGGYGDPTVIPFPIFQDVAQYSRVNLGYTHQWRELFALPYKGCLQASCDFPWEAKEAQSLGWKTFTTVVDDSPIKGGHLCMGKITTTCHDCKLRDGSKTNVYIPIHGQKKGISSFIENIATLAPSIV